MALVPPAVRSALVAETAATFAGDRASPAHARRFVDATLGSWQRGEFAERASLLVSELVTNAVLHAGTPLDVVLRLGADRLRVEVRDGSPRLPERKHYATTASTGRGLLLVEALAAAWGVEEAGGGKVVWFELVASELGEHAVVDLSFEDADLGDGPAQADPWSWPARPETSFGSPAGATTGSGARVLDG
jgi:hypothetical protein